MLPCARLSNHPCFAHFLRKKYLPKHIVNLVGARMVQIFPLQVHLRATQIFRHMGRIVQPGGSSRIFIQQFRKLPVKLRVILIILISFFQFYHCIHQSFRDILPAMNAKSSIRHILIPLFSYDILRTMETAS